MGPIGFQELLVILAILVLIFGATKLPQLGRGIGEGIRNFKKGLKSEDPRELEDGKEAS
jgi:sec-independent protein translocase protein TatA